MKLQASKNLIDPNAIIEMLYQNISRLEEVEKLKLFTPEFRAHCAEQLAAYKKAVEALHTISEFEL